MSVGDRERAEGPVWLTMWWPPHWDTALKGTQQWREKVSLSRKHRATPNGSTAGWGGKLGGQELTLSPFTPMSPLNPGKPSSPWERQRVKVGGAGRGLREHRQKGVDFRYGRAGGQEGRGEGRAGGHWGRGGQVGAGGEEGRRRCTHRYLEANAQGLPFHPCGPSDPEFHPHPRIRERAEIK